MYTDEKEQLVEVYEVVPVLEADQPKPQRPLWRRLVRVLLGITVFSMLWSTFVPMHSCGRHARKEHKLPQVPLVVMKPKQHYTFSSDISDFKIKQVSQSTLPTLTEVFGKVVVGSCNKAENISVYFDIHVSDDSLWDKIKIEPKDTGIVFSADPMSIVRQTVNITAFVVVPASKEFKLSTFQVETRELNIKHAPSFKTLVNGTYFETISGNITSYGKDSLDVVFSPYLSIKTTSGSIFGRFPLGNTTELVSATGDIMANITSADFASVPAHLTTYTVSGRNYITFSGDLHPRPLLSSHKTVSGDLKVFYPEDWQGSVKLASTTGKIDVHGTGLKVVKKKNGVTGRFYKAIKGDGLSKAYLGSTSGNVALAIGVYKRDE